MAFLTLIGLFLSFGSSAYLVYDTLMNFGKPKSIMMPVHEKDGNKRYIRLKRAKDWGFERTKRTPEETKLIIGLYVLSWGFLLQILDFFI